MTQTTRPANIPEVGEDGSPILADAPAQKKDGWEVNDPLLAEEINFFTRLFSLWIQFLDHFGKNHVHDGASGNLSAPKISLVDHVLPDNDGATFSFSSEHIGTEHRLKLLDLSGTDQSVFETEILRAHYSVEIGGEKIEYTKGRIDDNGLGSTPMLRKFEMIQVRDDVELIDARREPSAPIFSGKNFVRAYCRILFETVDSGGTTGVNAVAAQHHGFYATGPSVSVSTSGAIEITNQLNTYAMIHAQPQSFGGGDPEHLICNMDGSSKVYLNKFEAGSFHNKLNSSAEIDKKYYIDFVFFGG